MSPRVKRRLARTLHWRLPIIGGGVAFDVRLGGASWTRTLSGQVGDALRELGPRGRVIFLDHAPSMRDASPLAHVLALPSGLHVTYLRSPWAHGVYEVVLMCDRYSAYVAGGRWRSRWARVRVLP